MEDVQQQLTSSIMEDVQQQLTFYTNVDIWDHSATCEELLRTLPFDEQTHPPPTMEDIQQQLTRCKPDKAPGPDGTPMTLLKLCAMDLGILQHSIISTPTIVPVHKKPWPSELNHY
ncbi:60S ribosomal protein L4 [Lates japonicus]|uniref:60S ribosomal protein L4 n=1 Tax=Lates japonicus TaxID=270547 RepID=A0AAD3MWT1_LATJO|nr:60S ribosomal protein L4 [Lates japonicus]